MRSKQAARHDTKWSRGPGATRAIPLALCGTGLVTVALAVGLDPAESRHSAALDWPPFVLVAGLLLVGLVADGDGLFAFAGGVLARRADRPVLRLIGSLVLVAVTSALLNLDTAVAFLTPVLVHLARSRKVDEAPFLYGGLLLANAGSLLLPGSNLTNLIVLRRGGQSSTAFFVHLAPAFAVAVAITIAIVLIVWRAALSERGDAAEDPPRPRSWWSGVAVVGVGVAMVALRDPAPVVAGIGGSLGAVAIWRKQVSYRAVRDVIDLPLLLGLFAIAVALSTAGTALSGLQRLLAHLDSVGTAALGAAASILLNNLPAASLLAAARPPRPDALLIGLDVGPNLFVTGSLAWVLWLESARRAGAAPRIRVASRVGIVAAPLAALGALGALGLSGGH